MGRRRRLNRQSKTLSLSADTVQFIDDLKKEKHERGNAWGTHEITLSEIVDEAVGMLYHARIEELEIYCVHCSEKLTLKPSRKALRKRHEVIEVTCRLPDCGLVFNLAEAERVAV